MDYEHYDEDKRASKQGYDQTLTKKMAREMVGDGQTPNLWFVTYGPYVSTEDKYGEDMWELIDGYDNEKDTYTFGPFATYEEALNRYDEIELDIVDGVGQAFIEDRECGTVTEKWLTRRIKVDYVQEDRDDSKQFYKK